MKRHLILFFLFTSTIAFSQRAVINDSSILKKGIYQNFEEFKYNSPSIECDLKVEKGRMNYAYGAANYNFHQAYTIAFDSATKKRIKNVYGYCDGKSIFLRKEKTLEDYIFMVYDKHFEKDAYNKVIILGVYSCFEDIVNLGGVASQTNNGNYIQTSVRYDSDGKIVTLGIDMNTGEVFPLTKENLKIILKNDSILYKQYSTTKKPSIVQILQQFNKRHRLDGIYKNETPMKLEEANSFVKRQNADTLLNIYFKRVFDGLRKNNAFLNTSIFQEKHKNGTLKTIGIQTDHHYRQNDGQTLFKVGHWYHCYEDGSLKEEIEYDIFEKKIKSTKYNKNGDVVK
jgi:hypothetical protein